MTIKHLLCDLDETLLHTLSTTKNAYDCVFDSLNMPRKTAAEIKKATGGKPKSEIFGYMLCGETFAADEPYSLQTKKGLRTLNQKQMEEPCLWLTIRFITILNKITFGMPVWLKGL